jgi:sugar phosphate permease
MNALNKIGGFLLAAILAIAVISGLQTGTGREAGSSILDAGRSILSWAGDQISRVGGNVDTAGNLGRAMVIGLILFTALVLLVPKARAGRGFAVSAFASLIVALLLFQPSLGTSLRDAVSAPATGTVLIK